MVKLKAPVLQNFAGFRDITFDFTDDHGYPLNLAVLYGPNGEGKTSVLDAFLSLRLGDLLGDGPKRPLTAREVAERED